MDADTAAANREAARLKSLLTEVQQFEARSQAAAGARPADRAPARRPERARAAARPHQPQPARHAVADRAAAGRRPPSRFRGAAPRSSRSPISSATWATTRCWSEADRDRQQPGRARREPKNGQPTPDLISFTVRVQVAGIRAERARTAEEGARLAWPSTSVSTRCRGACSSARSPGWPRSASACSGTCTPTRCAADIDARRSALKKIQAEIARGQKTARRLPEFRKDVAALESQLEGLRTQLPEEQDVADLLRRVQGMATESNLTIRGFTPQPVTRKDLHAEWPIGLQVEGHLPRSGRVPRSGQQVPANHQRRQHQDRVAREPDRPA